MSDNSISPVFFLGIGLFIVPVLLGFIHIKTSNWFYTAGMISIVVGAFHTMLLRRKK